MKVYTRTGDAGTTSLVGGTRVSKNDARLCAYGTVDEANGWLGLLDSSDALPPEAHATLRMAMHRLFDIGAILATEPTSRWQPAPLQPEAVAALESAIDSLEASLPRHDRFVLPGGHPDAARANIARTVVRRAEREILELTAPDAGVLGFVNRLSDYLFVLSRAINHHNAHDEVYWSPGV